MDIKKFKFIKFIYLSINYRYKKIQIYYIYINPLIPFIMSIRKFKFIKFIYSSINYMWENSNLLYILTPLILFIMDVRFIFSIIHIYIYSYLLTFITVWNL